MLKAQFIALGLTEEQATKAEAESKKELEGYVERSKFDEVSSSKKELEKTVKERDTQLNDLKSKTGDNENLKKQIEDLQADNKKKDEEYKSQLKDLQISNAIKLAISDKAQDADLVASLFDKSKLILGDDGKVTGLDEQLKGLKESKAFLFKPEETKPNNDPTPGFKIGVNGNQIPADPGKAISMKDAIQAQLQAQLQK